MMPLANDPRFRAIMQLIENAEYAEAVQHLDALLQQLGPEDYVTAMLSKIRCLATLGDLKQARGLVEEALTQVDARSPLGICLKLQEIFLSQSEVGPDAAAVEIRSLLEQNSERIKTPDLQWAYTQAKSDLGNLLILAGRYSEGIKELEEALSLQNLPLARYYIYSWLGFAWNELGELDKAREYFERALGQEQSAPSAGLSPDYRARLRYELALIAYKQHRIADAVRQLEFASVVGVQDTGVLELIRNLKDLTGVPAMRSS
jgi:tetratricopeptide (TPR) repeat protein